MVDISILIRKTDLDTSCINVSSSFIKQPIEKYRFQVLFSGFTFHHTVFVLFISDRGAFAEVAQRCHCIREPHGSTYF
jgi:hypothetical protein